MGRRGEDNAATTGMLWVSGRATNGQFISCPLEQQVSCISAAGRVICVTLEDGGVQFIDLTATDEDGQPQFVARTWGLYSVFSVRRFDTDISRSSDFFRFAFTHRT
jgi:hypothetical protein